MSSLCSLFRQILNTIPRSQFEQLARQHRSERHARGFTRRLRGRTKSTMDGGTGAVSGNRDDDGLRNRRVVEDRIDQ
jgi:hypothetical protein